MPANLPYLSTPGTIKTALERIRAAATPDRVTQDFIQTKLQIKGGAGASVSPFLKKIGLAASDGSPTNLYHQFRNSQTSGLAIAECIRIGYREIFDVNEYCYNLDDKELISLITQVTGAEANSTTSKLTLSAFRNLKQYADFEARPTVVEAAALERLPTSKQQHLPRDQDTKLGLNLSYTINLNLPATADQAVFNAIFKSLREHLLDVE